MRAASRERTAWFVLAILLLFSIAAPLNQASPAHYMVSIFSCPAGGLLSDRIGLRKRLYVLGLVLTALFMPLMAVMGTNALGVLIIVQGLVGGLSPTSIFSAGVEVVGDERWGGLVMGAIRGARWMWCARV